MEGGEAPRQPRPDDRSRAHGHWQGGRGARGAGRGVTKSRRKPTVWSWQVKRQPRAGPTQGAAAGPGAGVEQGSARGAPDRTPTGHTHAGDAKDPPRRLQASEGVETWAGTALPMRMGDVSRETRSLPCHPCVTMPPPCTAFEIPGSVGNPSRRCQSLSSAGADALVAPKPVLGTRPAPRSHPLRGCKDQEEVSRKGFPSIYIDASDKTAHKVLV